MNHRRMRALFLVPVVAGVFAVLTAAPAQAQEPTGALAEKDCPPAPPGDPYTIGDSVTCTFTFQNLGFAAATVTSMTEQSPFPGGTPEEISCTLPNSTVISAGSTLAPTTPCTMAQVFTIPNDPALCNTLITDRADIALSYPQFEPPLEAGAFATHTIAVVCLPATTTTTTTATTTTSTTSTSTVPPTTPPGSTPPMLPATGGEGANLAFLSSAALVIGAALLLAVRRRARP